MIWWRRDSAVVCGARRLVVAATEQLISVCSLVLISRCSARLSLRLCLSLRVSSCLCPAIGVCHTAWVPDWRGVVFQYYLCDKTTRRNGHTVHHSSYSHAGGTTFKYDDRGVVSGTGRAMRIGRGGAQCRQGGPAAGGSPGAGPPAAGVAAPVGPSSSDSSSTAPRARLLAVPAHQRRCVSGAHPTKARGDVDARRHWFPEPVPGLQLVLAAAARASLRQRPRHPTGAGAMFGRGDRCLTRPFAACALPDVIQQGCRRRLCCFACIRRSLSSSDMAHPSSLLVSFWKVFRLVHHMADRDLGQLGCWCVARCRLQHIAWRKQSHRYVESEPTVSEVHASGPSHSRHSRHSSHSRADELPWRRAPSGDAALLRFKRPPGVEAAGALAGEADRDRDFFPLPPPLTLPFLPVAAALAAPFLPPWPAAACLPPLAVLFLRFFLTGASWSDPPSSPAVSSSSVNSPVCTPSVRQTWAPTSSGLAWFLIWCPCRRVFGAPFQDEHVQHAETAMFHAPSAANVHRKSSHLQRCRAEQIHPCAPHSASGSLRHGAHSGGRRATTRAGRAGGRRGRARTSACACCSPVRAAPSSPSARGSTAEGS